MDETFEDFTLATDFEQLVHGLEMQLFTKHSGVLYFRDTPFRISFHKTGRQTFTTVQGLFDQLDTQEYFLFESLLPGYKDMMAVKSAIVLALKGCRCQAPIAVQVQSEWKQLYTAYKLQNGDVVVYNSVHVPFVPQHMSSLDKVQKLVKIAHDKVSVVCRETYKFESEVLDRVVVCTVTDPNGLSKHFVAVKEVFVDTDMSSDHVIDERLEELQGPKQRPNSLVDILQQVFGTEGNLLDNYVNTLSDNGYNVNWLTSQAWNVFMDMVDKQFWQLQVQIPGVSSLVDNKDSLVMQKLQMLNYCILKSNGETDDVESGELERYGIDYYHQSVKLIDSDQPVAIPLTQDNGPMTSDMIANRVNILQALGTSDEAAQVRAKMQSQSLLGDMQAFKFANPSASIADFIRWHSPRDYDEETGAVSSRMEEGNLWYKLWEEAVPTHYKDQEQHFNALQEGQKALDYLQNIRQIELRWNLITLVVNCMAQSFGLTPSLQVIPYPYEDATKMTEQVKEIILNMENVQDQEAIRQSLREVFEVSVVDQLLQNKYLDIDSTKSLQLTKFNQEYMIKVSMGEKQVAFIYCESRDGCFRIVAK